MKGKRRLERLRADDLLAIWILLLGLDKVVDEEGVHQGKTAKSVKTLILASGSIHNREIMLLQKKRPAGQAST